MQEQAGYDIFISYAREDAGWVREHLYQPLTRMRTSDGRPPSIFLDVSERGIQPGQDFVEALSRAIQASRRVIPVYSRIYFQKPMCRWEVKKFWQLDPVGEHRKLNPVLIEAEAAAMVPFTFDHIQYVTIDQPDWLTRLARNLDLDMDAGPRVIRLAFETPPSDGLVGRVLAPVQVAVLDETGAPAGDLLVSLRLDGGVLEGTVQAQAEGGIATFADLRVDTPASAVSLTASADGVTAATSAPFSVLEPVIVATEAPSVAPEALIPRTGEVRFFENGSGVVVIEADRVSSWDRSGRCMAELPAAGPVRVVARGGPLIALAEWGGRVHVLASDGRAGTVDCGDEQAGGFHVPGDLAVSGDSIFVGMWNGEIRQVQPGRPPTVIARHEAGVDAMVILGPHLCVIGLDGALTHYAGTSTVTSVPLEEPVRWMTAGDNGLIAVGERRLLHYGFARQKPIWEDPGLDLIMDCVMDVAIPAVIDHRGNGVRVDGGLAIRGRFGATPRTRLSAADVSGRSCTLRHPDGTSTLLVGGRAVYTQSAGPLVVSPDGLDAVVAAPGGMVIRSVAELSTTHEVGPP